MLHESKDVRGQHVIYDEGGAWTGFCVRIMDSELQFATVCCNANHPPPVIISAPFSDISRWHDLAAVYDHGKMALYLDGEKVGEEETKYNVFDDGNIKEVSKTVSPALGEAVGINKLISSDLSLFKGNLEKCNSQDYFEKALELSIQDGMKIIPVDINKYLCMEIDFWDDLEQINKQL